MGAMFCRRDSPPTEVVPGEFGIQLVVWHRGSHMPSYYSVPPIQGWRIDSETRHIVIGRGVPRKLIPLDNVLSYDIERVEP